MREKITGVLDTIKILLEEDGLVLELVDVKEGIVTIKIELNCGSCGSSSSCSGATDKEQLRLYVERKLKADLHGIKEVVAV